MSDEGIKSTWRCAACGRENPATAARCSLCLAGRPGATNIGSTPGLIPPPVPDEDYPRPAPMSDFRRRLPAATAAALLIACGILTLAYGTGLGLLLILLPSLLFLYRLNKERPPEPVSVAHNAAVGCWAVAAAVALIISSTITFVGVCAPTGAYAIFNLAPEGYVVQTLVWVSGLIGGLLAAVGVSYGLVRLLFRRERRRDEPWEPPNTDIRP